MSAAPRFPTDHEPSIAMRPAVERFADFAAVVGPQPPGSGGCWCMSYRDGRVADDDRPADMRNQCAAAPSPGVRSTATTSWWGGCCTREPSRPSVRATSGSRSASPYVPDFAGTGWCTPWAGAVQHAAAHAAAHGAEDVEGYPVEAGDDGVDVISGYVGSAELFWRGGFQRAASTAARSGGRPRVVMRRALQETGRTV